MKVLKIAIATALIFATASSIAQVTSRNFPVIDAKTQVGRDAERQVILQNELKEEQAKADAASKALTDAKTRRLPAAAISDAEAALHRHEQNVATLKRELAGGGSVTEKNSSLAEIKNRESGLSNVSRLTRTQGVDRPAGAWDTWGRSAATKSQAQLPIRRDMDAPVVLRATSGN